MYERLSPTDVGKTQDPELRTLLAQGFLALGEEGLAKLVTSQDKFNTPVTIIEKNGRRTPDNNWGIKRVLKEVPVFVTLSTQVGLSHEQTEGLLMHLLDANNEYARVAENGTNIMLLNRALKQEVTLEQQFSEEDLDALKNMFTLAGKSGEIPKGIEGFRLARRAGLPLKDAVGMLSHLIEIDPLPGYTLHPHNQALSSLYLADVEPELIKQVFSLIGGKKPYYNMHLFEALEEMVTFACPSEEISPQDLFRELAVILEREEDPEAAINIFSAGMLATPIGQSEMKIYAPGEERDRHFRPKSGELELVALPYRARRTLGEGIKDLNKIMHARRVDREQVGEGMWAFDPRSDTWYSFGGKSTHNQVERSMGHKFLPYDLAQLSQEPYLFHVHSEDNMDLVSSPDAFPGREFKDQVDAFIAATPSRADYRSVAELMGEASADLHPRSFIVHPFGVTEFIYPHDINQLNNMALNARNIRSNVIDNFNWYRDGREDRSAYGLKLDEATIVDILLKRLNHALPEGFSLKLIKPKDELRNRN
jgi:hypothetical protein